VLQAAADPLESSTWLACLSVSLAGGGGDLAAVHAAGREAFVAAARAALPAWGARRICARIAAAGYAALDSEAGVAAQRPGALERAALVLGDWQVIRGELADVSARMLQALDELGILEAAGSIPGVSALSVAAILAESGDPSRFATSRARWSSTQAWPVRELQRQPRREARHLPPAAGLGRPAPQPRLRRPARRAGRPRERPAHHRPGPRCDRRRAAPPGPRHHHPPVPWDAAIAAGQRRPGQEVTAKAA